MIKKDIADTIQDAIDKMPPLPIVIDKVIRIANDPKSSAQDMVDVIQLDPVLTSRILQLINSAYFGLNFELHSLKQSIMALGFNTIKSVAFSTAILNKVSLKKTNVINPDEFWKHSFGVGVTSKMIAELSGVNKRYSEDFFVAGLIHDIGEILFYNAFPDECVKVGEMVVKKKLPLPEIEREVLGFSHEDIGLTIGKKWNFEPYFLYAVGKHHYPVMEGPHSKYSMIVSAANYMANVAGLSLFNEGFFATLPDNIWQEIGVDYSKVAESMPNVESEIEKARILLR